MDVVKLFYEFSHRSFNVFEKKNFSYKYINMSHFTQITEYIYVLIKYKIAKRHAGELLVNKSYI